MELRRYLESDGCSAGQKFNSRFWKLKIHIAFTAARCRLLTLAVLIQSTLHALIL